MSLHSTSRSEAALQRGVAEMGCHPNTAALLMLFAAAKHCAQMLGSERVAEIAYGIADDLAVGDRIL